MPAQLRTLQACGLEESGIEPPPFWLVGDPLIHSTPTIHFEWANYNWNIVKCRKELKWVMYRQKRKLGTQRLLYYLIFNFADIVLAQCLLLRIPKLWLKITIAYHFCHSRLHCNYIHYIKSFIQDTTQLSGQKARLLECVKHMLFLQRDVKSPSQMLLPYCSNEWVSIKLDSGQGTPLSPVHLNWSPEHTLHMSHFHMQPQYNHDTLGECHGTDA